MCDKVACWHFCQSDEEAAFLEESLEATTMHEPLPYPADGLEWHELLRGIGNVD